MDFGVRYPKPALKKTVPLLVIRILRMELKKIQAGEEFELTRAGKDAVRIYLRTDSECNSTDDDEAEVGYAEKFLQ